MFEVFCSIHPLLYGGGGGGGQCMISAFYCLAPTIYYEKKEKENRWDIEKLKWISSIFWVD